jgi:hypothetical protein
MVLEVIADDVVHLHILEGILESICHILGKLKRDMHQVKIPPLQTDREWECNSGQLHQLSPNTEEP